MMTGSSLEEPGSGQCPVDRPALIRNPIYSVSRGAAAPVGPPVRGRRSSVELNTAGWKCKVNEPVIPERLAPTGSSSDCRSSALCRLVLKELVLFLLARAGCAIQAVSVTKVLQRWARGHSKSLSETQEREKKARAEQKLTSGPIDRQWPRSRRTRSVSTETDPTMLRTNKSVYINVLQPSTPQASSITCDGDPLLCLQTDRSVPLDFAPYETLLVPLSKKADIQGFQSAYHPNRTQDATHMSHRCHPHQDHNNSQPQD
ncbi:hypothetical protein SRHO_G00114630 [Serrasalmus rhombeus]